MRTWVDGSDKKTPFELIQKALDVLAEARRDFAYVEESLQRGFPDTDPPLGGGRSGIAAWFYRVGKALGLVNQLATRQEEAMRRFGIAWALLLDLRERVRSGNLIIEPQGKGE